ncbi:MAG: DUF1641 domain-containing protein [Nitrospirota bacterium]|nr:DUF1641 domain-containing protein [Nitrospirota bacterium]MDH5768858.1 DUF1641 domain-containing protein [Nitrospirota bacterium]
MNKEQMVTDKVTGTNNNGKMAAQIDEIYNRFSLINNLVIDLSPALERISKELSVTIGELRERFERDETLKLIKKVGDNIPTFMQFLDLMESAKGMIADVGPAVGRISKETHTTIRELRERFEKDDTLILIKKIGDNIPTFITLLELMEVAKGLVEDLQPSVGRITKEVLPSINMLRESFEKEEVLDLLQNVGKNINAFNKLLTFLNGFENSGTLDFTLEQLSSKEMNSMMIGVQKCAVRTMQEITANPPKAGLKGIFAAMRDPEVLKGMVIMTAFARNMSLSLSETLQGTSSKT